MSLQKCLDVCAWVLGCKFVILWMACLRGGTTERTQLARARRHHRPGNSTARPPRRKADWILPALLHLAAHLPGASVRRLADTFNLIHGPRYTVGKTWVHDQLQAHRYQIECMRRDIRKCPPRPVSVNDVWGLDMTGICDGHGDLHGLVGIIDHGSRIVVRLRALPRKCSWTLLGHLCLAIAKFGKPRAVRTDNERVFTSFVFRHALRLLGIRHQRTKLASPWQNGRIERFWGTLKPTLRQLALPHRAGIQRALNEFALFYHHVRPHRHLDGRTPAMAWTQNASLQVPNAKRRKVLYVSACDGLLTGFYIRR